MIKWLLGLYKPVKVRTRLEVWRVVDSDWVQKSIIWLERQSDGYYEHSSCSQIRWNKVPPKILEKIKGGDPYEIEEFKELYL